MFHRPQIIHHKALVNWFIDKEARDDIYAKLEKVRYNGCISDIWTKIQMCITQPPVTGSALKKLILDQLPQHIQEHMYTVHLAGKSKEVMINIWGSAGWTTANLEEPNKNLSAQMEHSESKQMINHIRIPFQMSSGQDLQINTPYVFLSKTFVDRRHPDATKTYTSETETIKSPRIHKQRYANQWEKSAWPADRKERNETLNCFRWKLTDKGITPYTKPKEYQERTVGVNNSKENERDEWPQRVMAKSDGIRPWKILAARSYRISLNNDVIVRRKEYHPMQ